MPRGIISTRNKWIIMKEGGELNNLSANFYSKNVDDNTLKDGAYDDAQFSRYSPSGADIKYGRRLTRRSNTDYIAKLNTGVGVDNTYKRIAEDSEQLGYKFNDYQKTLQPNIKAGLSIENYKDPRDQFSTNLQGEAGVQYSQDKVNPYLGANISGRYNFDNRKRRLGYSEIGGNLTHPINLSPVKIHEVSTTADIDKGSDADMINTGQRRFNVYGELGLNLSPKTSLRGRIERNLFTNKNDYSFGLSTKFGDGGSVNTAYPNPINFVNGRTPTPQERRLSEIKNSRPKPQRTFATGEATPLYGAQDPIFMGLNMGFNALNALGRLGTVAETADMSLYNKVKDFVPHPNTVPRMSTAKDFARLAKSRTPQVTTQEDILESFGLKGLKMGEVKAGSQSTDNLAHFMSFPEQYTKDASGKIVRKYGSGYKNGGVINTWKIIK